MQVDDYVTIAPGATLSGAVRVGEGADLGTRCTAIQGIAIGAWSVVGAGAVLTAAVAPNVTVVGIPAKIIKSRAAGWHLE